MLYRRSICGAGESWPWSLLRTQADIPKNREDKRRQRVITSPVPPRAAPALR